MHSPSLILKCYNGAVYIAIRRAHKTRLRSGTATHLVSVLSRSHSWPAMTERTREEPVCRQLPQPPPPNFFQQQYIFSVVLYGAQSHGIVYNLHILKLAC
jgi:hypothetical protein